MPSRLSGTSPRGLAVTERAATAHIISLSLFDSIDEYTEDLEKGTAITKDVVPRTSPLLSFIENAFAQFFQNQVGTEIRGFDHICKIEAILLRRTKKSELLPETRSLIALFEQFCDVHDDVIGAGYGGQPSVLEEFHRKHVVRLLERLRSLAKARDDSELYKRVDSSMKRFGKAIVNHRWNS